MSESNGAPAVADTAPANPGTPGADGGPPPAADWKAGLPEDLRTAVDKYATPADLAKGYREAEKLIGKKGVILPGENATPEEMQAFHAALGVPPAPEGYELKAPEGIPEGAWSDDLAKAFAAEAHKLGLTPAQARGLAEWQTKLSADAMARQGMEPDGRTWEEALRADWGASYDANIATAVRAMKEFGDQEIQTRLGDRIGDAAMVRMFYNIGLKVAEDAPAGLGGGGTPSGAETIQAQINALMQDPKGPYWNTRHPDHKATVQQVSGLYEKLSA